VNQRIKIGYFSTTGLFQNQKHRLQNGLHCFERVVKGWTLLSTHSLAPKTVEWVLIFWDTV